MWIPLNFNDCVYKVNTDNKSFFELCVTNYLHLWITKLPEENVKEALKDSNPNLDLDGGGLLNLLYEVLQDGEADFKCLIEVNSFRFNAFTKRNGIPFRLKFILHLASPTEHFKHLTLQLLLTIDDLKKSENSLKDLLIKKDKEIEEYKAEGGQLFLKYLKTPVFNLNEHNEKFHVYDKTFGERTIDVSHLESIVKDPCKREVELEQASEKILADLKPESSSVEPSTQKSKRIKNENGLQDANEQNKKKKLKLF